LPKHAKQSQAQPSQNVRRKAKPNQALLSQKPSQALPNVAKLCEAKLRQAQQAKLSLARPNLANHSQATPGQA